MNILSLLLAAVLVFGMACLGVIASNIANELTIPDNRIRPWLGGVMGTILGSFLALLKTGYLEVLVAKICL
jgi:hypothetical protein